MIARSIAKQYLVLPSEQEDLRYSDWAQMVSGLMDDTPLGQVVRIRMENNPDVTKNFTPAQRQIKNDWAQFLANKARKDPVYAETQERKMEELERAIAALFGGVKHG